MYIIDYYEYFKKVDLISSLIRKLEKIPGILLYHIRVSKLNESTVPNVVNRVKNLIATHNT